MIQLFYQSKLSSIIIKMTQPLTILEGTTIRGVFQPNSPYYQIIKNCLLLSELSTLTQVSTIHSTMSTLSLSDEKKVPKKIIKERLYHKVNFSSVYPGSQNYKLYEIGSAVSWICETNDMKNKTSWIEIACNQPQTFTAILLQGRNDAAQWPTRFKIHISNDGKNYTQTFAGKQYFGCKDQQTIQTIELDHPLQTKYLRIIPTEYNNHLSLRFDALIIKDI